MPDALDLEMKAQYGLVASCFTELLCLRAMSEVFLNAVPLINKEIPDKSILPLTNITAPK